MDVRAVFGLSVLLSLAASGFVAAAFVWQPLRAMPRPRALMILATAHLSRFVGLSFLVSGVVSPALPNAFALPAAYGDLGAVALAWASVVALARRASKAVAVVWLLHIWGTLDFLYAFYEGIADVDPSMFGPAFFIPTAIVPPLLVDHILSFTLLVSRPDPSHV